MTLIVFTCFLARVIITLSPLLFSFWPLQLFLEITWFSPGHQKIHFLNHLNTFFISLSLPHDPKTSLFTQKNSSQIHIFIQIFSHLQIVLHHKSIEYLDFLPQVCHQYPSKLPSIFFYAETLVVSFPVIFFSFNLNLVPCFFEFSFLVKSYFSCPSWLIPLSPKIMESHLHLKTTKIQSPPPPAITKST